MKSRRNRLSLKKMSLAPHLPDFFIKSFRMTVISFIAGITGGLENVSVSKKWMKRPLAHRAVRSPIAVPQNPVKRSFFVLSAFIRFKPALCGIFLALTLSLPLKLFPLEMTTELRNN